MVEDETGPVVARLLLGDELRNLRESVPLTVEQAEAKIKESLPKWYRTKLNKVENGGLKTTEAEIAVLLDLYGVSGQHAVKVEQLAKEARRKVAAARVPDWFKQFVSLSRSATEMRMWWADSIPGHLHTAAYAHASLSESVVISAAEAEPMAKDREKRGDLLFSGKGPRLYVIVGEEALRRWVGNREIMRGQLERIRALSELPHASFRVIKLRSGPHAALGYPFTLLYVERAKATIAYVETLTDADYIKKSGTYILAFERIEQKAASEDESRALLDELIADLDKEN